MPEQQGAWRAIMILARRLRLHAVAKHIVSGHGVIAAVKHIALPLTVENPFARAAFVAAVFIDRTPARDRPARDRDRNIIGAIEQTPIAT
jgi:hypothetical protein